MFISETYRKIASDGIWNNNIVFGQNLALCPLLAVTGTATNGLGMGLATLVIFFAVVHRYSSGIPWVWQYTRHLSTSWTQELCIYLFIWMAKFGAAYGVRAHQQPRCADRSVWAWRIDRSALL